LVDGKIAGMFDFHNIDHDNHHCEIGYWLGKAFQHNGVMTNVVKEATKIGFNELKMHTIQIFAVVDNGPSNRVALNAGFNLEGTLKEYLLANGRYQNSNIYSQMTAKK
jgi:ribosomal-protein-serine acetyltransferase